MKRREIGELQNIRHRLELDPNSGTGPVTASMLPVCTRLEPARAAGTHRLSAFAPLIAQLLRVRMKTKPGARCANSAYRRTTELTFHNAGSGKSMDFSA